jgi:hypothetical protein
MMIHELDVPRLRTIDSSFDRDLEAIVARATERRIKDRIATAGELATYLQLYLDGQPLSIRPPSKVELGRRWVRRHKGRVATGCAAVVLLITASIGAWYWDMYVRTHTTYYENVIKRWGVMEGVARISKQEAGHKARTFKFSRRGRRGPVVAVEAINGHGVCTPSPGLGAYIDWARRGSG